MPTPFPGMDPYLEHPALWPDVHNALIIAIRDSLVPVLRPRYIARVEARSYYSDAESIEFVGRPDVAIRQGIASPSATSPEASSGPMALDVEVPLPDRIRETFLDVRDTSTGELVTALEVLSPDNKRPGRGQRLYLRKRARVLGSLSNLVEVDLLRAGERMPLSRGDSPCDYRILISRGDRRPRADLLAFGVRDAIPRFKLPLRPGDAEPEVDLGAVLHALYDRAGYDMSIDYRLEPVPPLGGDDQNWARSLLCAAGLRPL